jgi:hypothetical protein
MHCIDRSGQNLSGDVWSCPRAGSRRALAAKNSGQIRACQSSGIKFALRRCDRAARDADALFVRLSSHSHGTPRGAIGQGCLPETPWVFKKLPTCPRLTPRLCDVRVPTLSGMNAPAATADLGESDRRMQRGQASLMELPLGRRTGCVVGAAAHRTFCGGLDRRRERATSACPCAEGLLKTSPSRRW